MKVIGNIIWFIFGGLEWCLCLLIAGVLCCVTIIGIPVGLQLFKMAGFVIWPFGKRVTFTKPSGFKTFLNVLWAILLGWEFALGVIISGCIYCITIIGIPFGKQYFKLAKFIFLPLGRSFVKTK